MIFNAKFLLLTVLLHGASSIAPSRIVQLPLSRKVEASKLPKTTVHNHNNTVVCVLDSWSHWRKSMGTFQISDVDPNLCSQIIYRNAAIDNKTYAVNIRDPHLAIELQWVKRLVDMSKAHPHLKILLSVGGWDEGAKTFSEIARDSAKRDIFVESVLQRLDEHKFHGLDFAWEYPAWGLTGGSPDDKENLPLLLKDLKKAFNGDYILSLTVPGSKDHMQPGYNVRAISNIVDQITIRSFGYSGGWDSQTNHHSALIDSETRDSVMNSCKFFLDGGCPPEKLIMGVSFTGRTFLLKEEPSQHDDIVKQSGLGQPSFKSFGGYWVPDNLVLGYHELCYNITNTEDVWHTYRDTFSVVPFARSGKRWVTYDDVESIEAKVAFAVQSKLKGIMAWSIDTDDFKGSACRNPTDEDEIVTFPLLRTINYGLYLGSSARAEEKVRSAVGGEGHENHDHHHTLDPKQGSQKDSKKLKKSSSSFDSAWSNSISLSLLLISIFTAYLL